MSTSCAQTSGHIDARRRGKVGELLCAYKLAACCGVDVVHVDMLGYDLVAICPISGLVLRVECKSAHKTVRDSPGHTPTFHFSTSTGSKVRKPINPQVVDVVALIDVTGERVWFRTVASLRGRKTIKATPAKFDKPDLEQTSWNECMRYFADIKGGNI